MMEKDLMDVVRASKYPLEAYLFLQRGLDFTAHRIHGELKPNAHPSSRHVNGRQLCQGLRDYAVQQYGLLARAVLRRWHIYSSEDFGRIVFALVDAGLMQKTEGDSIRDFIDVYDFAEAFAPSLILSEHN